MAKLGSKEKSVREQIMISVKEAIESVTKENGYATHLQKVMRTFRIGDPDMPYACVVGSRESKTLAKPHMFYQCSLDVSIWLFIFTAYMDNDDADEVMTRALADVETALTNKAELRGGDSANTLVDRMRLTDNELVLFGEHQPMGALRVGINLQYLHEDQDPDSGR